MDVEDKCDDVLDDKDRLLSIVRQQLQAFTAQKLLQFEKRIRQRFEQTQKEIPEDITEGTMRVFKEFEKVCDKYIGMFELYCERNVFVSRFKDTKITPLDNVCDEERELDMKLEKRKRELLECYRKKNIVQIQRSLIQSDFGVELARLGALASQFSLPRLRDDVQSLRQSEHICEEAQKLRLSLQSIADQVPAEWNSEQNEMNMEMMQGIMQCFDEAGLP